MPILKKIILGASLALSALVPASAAPAFESGQYRNLFAEHLGKTEAELDAKLQAVWDQFSIGDPATQLSASLRQKLASHGADQLKRVDGELRAAAQLILQDVIDDFVPQIEAELKRRLESRLDQLLPRKP